MIATLPSPTLLGTSPRSAAAHTLPATMKAVVAYGPNDYRMETVPTPVAGAGEVVIKVKNTGICASDIKCYTGAPMFWGEGQKAGYCVCGVQRHA